MVTLTLKDIPPELHRRLRARAEATGRSLNKEILACLDQITSSRRVNIPDYLSKVERIHAGIDFRMTLDEMQGAVDAGRP
jgi:plasmid stability protein